MIIHTYCIQEDRLFYGIRNYVGELVNMYKTSFVCKSHGVQACVCVSGLIGHAIPLLMQVRLAFCDQYICAS